MLLKFGNTGHEVKQLQNNLKQLGLYPFASDSIFGAGTQNAVMRFQSSAGLQIDGIVGDNTYKAIQDAVTPQTTQTYTIDEIVAVMQAKGYKLRTEKYRINIIGVRKDNVFDNKFSDTLYVIWKNKLNKWELRNFKWTTLAGTLGEGGAFNPITVLGVTGVAVLKEAQYLDTYAFIDNYTTWLGYPFFMQTKSVMVYRDGNCNDTVDYAMPQQSGLFGINLHRMSNNDLDSDFVNFAYASWSIGCNGSPEPTFKQVIELARVTAKLYGNVFDYTLLHSNDFNARYPLT